ncbi:MAG: restriction endonuclease [archaeon]|nr:restriction endonuclease [archaeon]MCP8306656.1 restriction endonuclease [archaeon]
METRPTTIIKLIPNIIEGEHDLIEMARDCGLSFEALKEALGFLKSKKIAELDGDTVRFEKGAKVLTAVSAVKLGSSVDEVSKALNWKDFEEFTCFILEYNGYRVYQNFRLRNPRREIDVLAVKDDRGLVIDCKHRHRSMGVSSISKVAKAQVERAEELMKSEEAKRLNLSHVIPLIVTLYSEKVFFMNKVPVVPIDKFRHFLYELDGLLDTVLIVR